MVSRRPDYKFFVGFEQERGIRITDLRMIVDKDNDEEILLKLRIETHKRKGIDGTVTEDETIKNDVLRILRRLKGITVVKSETAYILSKNSSREYTVTLPLDILDVDIETFRVWALIDNSLPNLRACETDEPSEIDFIMNRQHEETSEELIPN